MLTRYIFVFTLLLTGLQVAARPAPLPQDVQQPAPAPGPQDQQQPGPPPQDQQQPAPAPQDEDQQQPARGPAGQDEQQQPQPTDAQPSASAAASASDSAQSSTPSHNTPAGLSGEVDSDIPLSCIAGCSLAQTLYESCVDDRNSSCTQFCTTANYTRAITCLNCLVVQGSSLSGDQLLVALKGYTDECKRVRGSRFGKVPSLAGSATTTEGTSTSLGETEYLPTWSAFNLPSNAAIPTDVGSLGSRIGGSSGQQSKREFDQAIPSG